MKKISKRKGFTLVELVVVMAIIGVLVLLAVPRFISMIDGARSSTTQSNHRTLVSAYAMWLTEHKLEDVANASDLIDELMGADAWKTVPDLTDSPKGAEYTTDGDTDDESSISIIAVYERGSDGTTITYEWNATDGYLDPVDTR